MKISSKVFITPMILTMIVLIACSVQLILAWIVFSDSDTEEFIVGEITITLDAEDELQTDITLTSPTFLLDPEVKTLLDAENFTSPLYLDFLSQFSSSVHRVIIDITNTGNISGKFGYGAIDSETYKGLDITLVNTDTENPTAPLVGIVFVVLEHDPDLESSDLYPILMDVLETYSESTIYTNFSALKASLEAITQETITALKAKTIAASETVQLDVFIWQEYYDGANYESSHDDFVGGNLHVMQTFDLQIKAYFGQLGITN